MADKRCRWLYRDSATAVCEHPLLMFHDQEGMEIDGAKMYGGDSVSGCHGCPCHEPQASVVKESLTTQPDPNGSIRPESDETAPVRVHDKP